MVAMTEKTKKLTGAYLRHFAMKFFADRSNPYEHFCMPELQDAHTTTKNENAQF
jgi:hypothetical protein